MLAPITWQRSLSVLSPAPRLEHMKRGRFHCPLQLLVAPLCLLYASKAAFASW
jgi:hypothetical protein